MSAGAVPSIGVTFKTVTDAVMAEVSAWQAQPLEPMTPVVFFDALRVKMRDDAAVRNKAAYLALAVVPGARRRVRQRGALCTLGRARCKASGAFGTRPLPHALAVLWLRKNVAAGPTKPFALNQRLRPWAKELVQASRQSKGCGPSFLQQTSEGECRPLLDQGHDPGHGGLICKSRWGLQLAACGGQLLRHTRHALSGPVLGQSGGPRKLRPVAGLHLQKPVLAAQLTRHLGREVVVVRAGLSTIGQADTLPIKHDWQLVLRTGQRQPNAITPRQHGARQLVEQD